MKFPFVFLAACILSLPSGFSREPADPGIPGDSLALSIGYRHTLESKILEQSREIFIHLPRDPDPGKTYPLVMILDAEMTFKSFASTTELMGWQELIPECIVIGIPNINREVDHAPVIEGIPESGRADLMIRFYEEELFPYLQSEFRIGRKILWGHSWLGLFTSYVMLTRPGLFDAYMSTSPAYRFLAPRFEEEALFGSIGDEPVLFYMSLGSEEPMTDEMKRLLQRLEEDAPGGLTWVFKLNEGKNHDSNALLSYMEGLEWCFGKWKE